MSQIGHVPRLGRGRDCHIFRKVDLWFSRGLVAYSAPPVGCVGLREFAVTVSADVAPVDSAGPATARLRSSRSSRMRSILSSREPSSPDPSIDRAYTVTISGRRASPTWEKPSRSGAGLGVNTVGSFPVLVPGRHAVNRETGRLAVAKRREPTPGRRRSGAPGHANGQVEGAANRPGGVYRGIGNHVLVFLRLWPGPPGRP